jgi:transcriptional regulator with XRE-family HTH domain
MVSVDSRIFLLRKGVTQKQIADALGVHKSTISLLLSGQIKAEARLDQVAAYLGISRRLLNSLIHPKPKRKLHKDTQRCTVSATAFVSAPRRGNRKEISL